MRLPSPKAVLRRWLGPRPSPVEPDAGPAPRDPDGALDLRPLMAIVGTDQQAVQRYLELYLSTAAAIMERVTAALAARDTGELRRAAHELRGSSGTLGAVEMARAAGELERTAADSDWSATERCCQDLHTAFARTMAQARALHG